MGSANLWQHKNFACAKLQSNFQYEQQKLDWLFFLIFFLLLTWNNLEKSEASKVAKIPVDIYGDPLFLLLAKRA